MSIPTVAIQKAVYQKLSSALGAVIVYDSVPQETVMPYVSIDRVEVMASDYLASRKDERFVYLSVWSRYRGQKEVLDVLSVMDGAMHNAALNLENGHAVSCRVVRQNTSRDSDGLTFQGSMTLAIRTTH